MLTDKINGKEIEISSCKSQVNDLERDIERIKREVTDLREENKRLVIDLKAMNLFEST